MNARERFRSKIIKIDGCWLWTGRTAGGVPIFEVDGRRVTARRWIWNKGPRPEYIGSTCGDRLCVRPSHLVAIKRRQTKPPPEPDEIVLYMQTHRDDVAGCMLKFDVTKQKLIDILNFYYLGQPTSQDKPTDAEADIDHPLHEFRP